MIKVYIAYRMHQADGISEEQAAALLDWILDLFKSTLQRGTGQYPQLWRVYGPE
jgi:hypothetical protein